MKITLIFIALLFPIFLLTAGNGPVPVACTIIEAVDASIEANSSNCELVVDDVTSPDIDGMLDADMGGDCDNVELTHNAGGPDPHTLIGVTLSFGVNNITWTATDTSGGGSTEVDTENQTITVTSSASFTGSTTFTPGSTSCPGVENGSIYINEPPSDNLSRWSISPNEGTFSQVPEPGSPEDVEVTGLPAGSYVITYTNGDDCTISSSSINVTNGAGISLGSPMVMDESCAGADDGEITISATGGSGDYDFELSNGDTELDGNGDGTVTFTDVASGTNYSITVTEEGTGCTDVQGGIDVDAGSSFTVTLNATPPSCNNDNDATIEVNTSGGSGPFDIFWDGTGLFDDDEDLNESLPYTITGLDADEWDVTVIDDNGCEASNSVVINDPGVFSFSANETQQTCSGGSTGVITINGYTNGNSPYDITWDGPGGNDGSSNNVPGNFQISGLPAGDYDIDITDDNGCTASVNNVEITALTSVDVTIIGDTEFCPEDNNGTLSTNPGGFSDYDWSTGSSNSSISIPNPGATPDPYSVTVTDGSGCTGVASVNVEEQDEIQISLNGGPSKLEVTCESDCDGKIDVSVSGGGSSGFSYSWTGPGNFTASTQDIDDLCPGTYNLTVTDNELGCSKTFQQAITAPSSVSASASPSSASCFGEDDGSINLTVSGGTPGYTFEWSNGAGTEDISGLEAGSYTVTVTDGNGCFTTASATVGQPNQVVATIVPSSPEICVGKSIQLTAGGGTSYQWSNGAGSSSVVTVSPQSTTTYTVTVTDAGTNNCTATKQVTVTVNPLPNPVISISETSGNTNNDGEICEGSSITLTASGGTSYNWDNGAPNPLTVSPTVNSSYNVTVTDQNGCTETASTSVVVNENPTASINLDLANQTVNQPQNIQGTADANCGSVQTCQWFANGNPIGTDCGSVTPQFSQPGEVEIEYRVTNSCGCFVEEAEFLDIANPDDCVITEFALNNGNGIACVGEVLPLSYEGSPSLGCDEGVPRITVTRFGNATTAAQVLGNTITFSNTGMFEVTFEYTDGCGECMRERTRVIEVIDPPEVSFSPGNPMRACQNESINIAFDGYDAGERVVVTGVSSSEVTYAVNNFNLPLNEPGTRNLEIIAVLNDFCGVEVNNQELTIEVLPELQIDSTDKICNDELVTFDYYIRTTGGDPLEDLNVDGGSVTLIGDRELLIRNLDPSESYNFTLSRGDLCDPLLIEIPAAPCNCTFNAGSRTDLTLFGCEDEVFDLSLEDLVNSEASEFDPETDTLIVVLHSAASGSNLGIVYDVYPSTLTSVDNNFEDFVPGTPYYLSVVGVRKATFDEEEIQDFEFLSNRGSSDCYSVVNGIPVTWFRTPAPNINTKFGLNEICANEYDFMVFVPNVQDGSSLNFEVLGQPESIVNQYGSQDTAYIHFSDLSQDSFIVRVTEVRTNFDPISGNSKICEGFSDITLYVKPNTMAPDVSNIIFWPGNILSSTADTTTTCFRWGYHLQGVEVVDSNSNSRFYYAPSDIDFGTTNRIYFVETYECSNPECITRIYFNAEGPPPGLNYKTKQNYSFLVRPNPNRGLFNLDLYSKYENAFQLDLIDVTGKVLYTENVNFHQGRNIKEFDFYNLDQGIYFLRIIDNSNKQYSIEKIIVQ